MEHLLGLFEDKFEEISIKIRAINITEEMKSTSKLKKIQSTIQSGLHDFLKKVLYEFAITKTPL